MPITQAYSNPTSLPCETQCAALLDMTAGTHDILLVLALVIGLSMLFLYFKIHSTLGKTNEALGEIGDLFDTLE